MILLPSNRDMIKEIMMAIPALNEISEQPRTRQRKFFIQIFKEVIQHLAFPDFNFYSHKAQMLVGDLMIFII